MYGAIIGDICGSVFEFDNFKTENPAEIPMFANGCRFSDDSVLTCAVMDAVLTDGKVFHCFRLFASFCIRHFMEIWVFLDF